MKVVILSILVLFSVVYAEDCPGGSNAECSTVCCKQGSVACVNKICTCAQTSGHGCTTREECHTRGICGPLHIAYCVNGQCKCEFH